MKGKKKFLASCLNASGILQLIANVNNNSLTVFNYHRIFSPPLVTFFDEGVYAHSEQFFYNQMRWIKKNFFILCEEELINIIEKGVAIPNRCAMVTFDDGYRDNYDIAFPILKELRIPAIFFIPYLNIEKGLLGWWDHIAFIINKTNITSLSLNNYHFSLQNEGGKKSTIDELLNHFKNIDYDKSKSLVKTLSELCDVELPDETNQRKELMTWDQIKEVNRYLIDIGSHTMTHRVLSRLGYKEQVWEIKESKLKIQEKLGTEIKSIAYPVGSVDAFTKDTKNIAINEDYKLGFSFYNGNQKRGDLDPFNIKRIDLAQNMPLYKAQTIMPEYFCYSTR